MIFLGKNSSIKFSKINPESLRSQVKKFKSSIFSNYLIKFIDLSIHVKNLLFTNFESKEMKKKTTSLIKEL